MMFGRGERVYKDMLFPFAAVLLGIACMAYASLFCRRMRAMGEDFPRRAAARVLGQEASPEAAAQALKALRRRVRLAGLALAALFLALLAGCFLLAPALSFSPRPLALAGLALLSLSFSLCAFMLAGAMRPGEKG